MLRAKLEVWIAPAQLAAEPEHVVMSVIRKPLLALAAWPGWPARGDAASAA